METLNKRPLMFSNRALIALALPIIIDALLAVVAGMVDSAMVSSVGEAAVSAVSLVDNINILFVTMFSSMGTGGAVVASQYIGKGDIKKAKEASNQLVYLSVAISVVVTVALMCCIPQTINLIYGSVEEDVFNHCKTYYFFTLIGYPLVALGTSSAALLRAMAKSKQALVVAAAANIFNVIGNAVLIFGFDMGVMGAAISTTLCRAIWGIGGIIMLHSKKLPVKMENLFKFKLNFDIIRRVSNIGVATGIESGLFQIGKILVASLVSTMGTIAITANSVANTVCNLGWNTVGSLGLVLLTVVGQCMGAGEPEQAKMYTKKITYFALGFVVVLFGSIFLLRNQIILIFSFTPEAMSECAKFVGIGALLTICSVYAWSFIPVNAFRAAGDTRYAVILAVSSMFTFRVGLSYLLGAYLKMGLIGVWIGMWADWTCRTIFNIFRFRSGKWLTKKVI